MSAPAITPYLFFSGRCDEAIAFYAEALGAEVEMLMRYRESPVPPPPGMLQPGFEDKVMHATLRVRGVPLMLSDGANDRGKFEGFRVALALPDEAEARRAFDALADGGTVEMPPTKTFWSPCFGMLTDRFGLEWMISVPGPSA
jgi:PhnB protein